MIDALQALEERFVLVVGAKCQGCGAHLPLPPEEMPANAKERNAEIDSDWRRRGIGSLVQEWPKRLPAWLVRGGFTCPLCEAPNMLLALEPDTEQEVTA